MNSLFIAHRPGCTTDKRLIRSCQWHRVADVLPMSVHFHCWTLGFRQFKALTLLLRRCRATVYTSSAVPRFTWLSFNRYMLLFPFPFGSRLVVHLGVIYPELRPPPVAILSVRDMAHPFDSPWLSIRLSNVHTLRKLFLDFRDLCRIHD
jgi:hypothetical protein